MDIAIVTGAETPLGLRIVQTLVQQGCRVHGIGNNFSKVTYADAQFEAHAIDLSDLDAVAATLNQILEKESRLDCLVHAIDVTPGAAFEKLSVGNLEAILKVGLLGPVMMTRLALPNLLRFRGQLINMITSNKHGSPASAANALIEGGLRDMNRALQNQARDSGLRVTNCILRQNTTMTGAAVSDEVIAQSRINLEDVGRTVQQLLDPNVLHVPSELELYPRLSAEAEQALPKTPVPLDPYDAVALPPKEYRPPEQPKIKTADKQNIERTIPYSDEEMEDKIAAAIEDFEAHPERYEDPGASHKKNQQQQGGPPNQGQGKRRRRRRGGRNRNKGQHDKGPAPDNKQDQPKPPQEKPPEKQKSPKNQKQGNKPKPHKNKDDSGKPEIKQDKPSGKPARKAGKKPTGKKPAKKAAKKMAKKPAPDKEPAKKPKNLPKKKTAAKKAAKKKAAKKKAIPKKVKQDD